MSALLDIRELTVRFRAGAALAGRLRGRAPLALTALDRVSLEIQRGESVGIVGESGCGKTTLAKALVGLVPVTSGSIWFDRAELADRRPRAVRRRIQMVFQDPSSSLNPSRTVGQTLAELLRVHRMVPRHQLRARCEELLDLVELPRSALGAYPRTLSGGQRQRVGIARALALGPEVLIADEAVAALDVSVQAATLNVLADLGGKLGLTLLFISHDLAVVRHVSDRVVVMYLGRVVEDRPTERVFADPRHPYTRALMAAAPKLGTQKKPGETALAGEPPSALEVPSGCSFHPRCPLAQQICRETEPALEGPPRELAACFFAWDNSGQAGRPERRGAETPT